MDEALGEDSANNDYEAPEILSVEQLGGKLQTNGSGTDQPWGGL